MPSLRSMVVFGRVAETGSFRGAAKVLGLSPSNVSQHVTRLEQALGVKLMNRTTRAAVLTDAGEVFAARCRQLRELSELAEDEVRELERRPRGPLAITLPHAFEQGVVHPAIETLCREFPEVLPRLVTTDRRLDLVKHDLDIAISVGALSSSDYRARRVGVLHEIFCASPRFLADKRIATPADLESERWIAATWQQRRKRFTLTRDGSDTTIQCRVDIAVETLTSAAQLAERGLGIALLPDFYAAPLLQQRRLVDVLPGHVGFERPISVVHPYGRRPPLAVRRMSQLIANQLESVAREAAIAFPHRR